MKIFLPFAALALVQASDEGAKETRKLQTYGSPYGDGSGYGPYADPDGYSSGYDPYAADTYGYGSGYGSYEKSKKGKGKKNKKRGKGKKAKYSYYDPTPDYGYGPNYGYEPDYYPEPEPYYPDPKPYYPNKPYKPANNVQCGESKGYGCACAVEADGPTAQILFDPDNNILAYGTTSCDESIFFPDANVNAASDIPFLGAPLDCTTALTFVKSEDSSDVPTCLLNGEGMSFISPPPIGGATPVNFQAVFEITGGALECEGASGTLKSEGGVPFVPDIPGPVQRVCSAFCTRFLGLAPTVFTYELDYKLEHKQCGKKIHPYNY